MACKCVCFDCCRMITYDDKFCPYCKAKNDMYELSHVSEKELNRIKCKLFASEILDAWGAGKEKKKQRKLRRRKEPIFDEAEILALDLYPNDPLIKEWLMERVRNK